MIGTDEWIADDGSWVSFSTVKSNTSDKQAEPYEEFFGDWDIFYKTAGHYNSSKERGLRV